MNEIILIIFAGLTLGAIHAFDADHVAAVVAFVSKNPKPRKAMLLGIFWALGHTATLFVFGLLALGLKFVFTPLIESIAEAAVGVLLIGIGGWIIVGLLKREKIHIHKHKHDGVEHVHIHSHKHSEGHHHKHSIFLFGAAHGFAGTAAVLLIIPVTVAGSVLTAALYIILFGIGTMVAMGLFAYMIGRIARTVSSKNALHWFQGVAGSMSVIIGVVWIAQILL